MAERRNFAFKYSLTATGGVAWRGAEPTHQRSWLRAVPHHKQMIHGLAYYFNLLLSTLGCSAHGSDATFSLPTKLHRLASPLGKYVFVNSQSTFIYNHASTRSVAT